MRVNYYFSDKIDTYKVEAEVSRTNRVTILTIEDSYGSDVDFDDFSEDEKKMIYAKAYAARDALEASEEPDYDGDADAEGEAAYD
jgi:hypothetical protein